MRRAFIMLGAATWCFLVAPAPQAPPDRAPERGGARAPSPELVECVLEVARQVEPDLAARLEETRALRPDEMARALREARHLLSLCRLRERDPGLYQDKIRELCLDAEISRIARALREAAAKGTPEAEGLEAQLRAGVEEQVAWSFKARGGYLLSLKKRVQELRDELDRDAGDFGATLERRIKELLDPATAAGDAAGAGGQDGGDALESDPTPGRASGPDPGGADQEAGWRPPHRPGVRLERERFDAVLEVAREVDPALADRLERLHRSGSARELHEALAGARDLRGLFALRKRDPEMYETRVEELRLQAEVRRLAAELREARRLSSPGAEDLDESLREQVSRQLAYSIVARGRYLLRLEERVRKIHDELARDGENFKATVERRMREALEQSVSSGAIGQ